MAPTVLAAPPTPLATPTSWVPASPTPTASAAPAPSAVGRRAPGFGWVVAVGGAILVLVAAVGVLVIEDRLAVATGPAARWDRLVYDGTEISPGVPFRIEVEAVNPANAPTDRVWMIVDWQPDDRAYDPDAVGRWVSCEPGDCHYRDDPEAATTIVYWPGLAPGGRRVYTLTAQVEGIEPGQTFHYEVRTGTGPGERAIDGGNTWRLDLDVQ
jgi:hypothetical protein